VVSRLRASGPAPAVGETALLELELELPPPPQAMMAQTVPMASTPRIRAGKLMPFTGSSAHPFCSSVARSHSLNSDGNNPLHRAPAPPWNRWKPRSPERAHGPDPGTGGERRRRVLQGAMPLLDWLFALIVNPVQPSVTSP